MYSFDCRSLNSHACSLKKRHFLLENNILIHPPPSPQFPVTQFQAFEWLALFNYGVHLNLGVLLSSLRTYCCVYVCLLK